MNPPLSLSCDANLLKSRAAQEWAHKVDLGKARWKGLSWTLNFFKKPCVLTEIMNEDDIDQKRYYIIECDGQPTLCQYGTDVVEDLVKQAGLAIDQHNIQDYILFYLGFTRGQAGRVLAIQTVDDLHLREELTLITRRNLQAMITPMHVVSDKDIEGCFLITNKLFKALASVDENGSVLLKPKEILADTLPVQDQALRA